ncbi:hypothetical protein COV20_04155 [Candidatus Woesearchaeota archaeon CG10_big_fil_rev_8_21_14_0_10_45_16]|nr:MAG: hypothetical protein COV20_04155 [Candidatus Woesearchaeota archaeon CG10_big_fil_rev_8_21_14_0_10_45_16]
MVTKTITVTEEAYNSLKGLKGENESFSDVLLRIGKKRSTVSNFLGILKGGDISEARRALKRSRDDFSRDAEKRYNALFGHKRST